MSNIPSNNIVIFPLSKARNSSNDVARESKIFFENNIANIVRQMLDTKGFIISPSSEDTGVLSIQGNEVMLSSGSQLEFNIGGYYVRIFNEETETEGSESIPLVDLGYNITTGSIYASITLDGNKEISWQDTPDNLFAGLNLEFLPTDPEDKEGTTYFKLIDIKIDAKGQRTAELCKDSYIKFNLNSYKFPKFIDGQR